VTGRALSIEVVLTLLAETQPRIAALTADFDEAQLSTRPAQNAWSANDVLAHLRACADVWGGCIARILDEDKPTIRAVNPRSWIKKTDYLDLPFQPSLRAFTAQRAELLAVLQPLSAQDWSRAATVIGGGRPLELTVTSYAQRLARHEPQHVKQIARAVKGA